MEIKIYNCTDDKKNVKKNGKTLLATVTCHLKENTSRSNPVFVLQGRSTALDTAIAKINYLYCGDFGRYYFVNDVVMLKGGMLELNCKCDTLTSAKNYLLSKQALVTRQEKISDSYIADEKIIIGTKRKITRQNIGSGNLTNQFTNASPCIALTVTGGASE